MLQSACVLLCTIQLCSYGICPQIYVPLVPALQMLVGMTPAGSTVGAFQLDLLIKVTTLTTVKHEHLCKLATDESFP